MFMRNGAKLTLRETRAAVIQDLTVIEWLHGSLLHGRPIWLGSVSMDQFGMY